MKTITVRCEHCSSEFQKPINEYNRRKKKKSRLFCSRKCSGQVVSKYNLLLANANGQYDISVHANNCRDEFTGIRSHLRRAKQRFKDVEVSLQDLKDVWEDQCGMCPYTGMELLHPKHNGINDPILTASLDRIDSNRGYVRGNVQFVSMAINYAKNKMSHNDMVRLCEIIAAHHSTK
jgi:hypothetical protein